MKIIQTLKDMEGLKAINTLPLPYIKVIEQQFRQWYEVKGIEEEISMFCLPKEACLYHLETKEDVVYLFNPYSELEFVETERIYEFMYFRCGVRTDSELNLMYFLEGTLPSKIEHWLQN